jgi:hypothetical protein
MTRPVAKKWYRDGGRVNERADAESTALLIAGVLATLVLFTGSFFAFSAVLGIGWRGATAWTIFAFLMVAGTFDNDEITPLARILLRTALVALGAFGLVDRLGRLGAGSLVIAVGLIPLAFLVVVHSRARRASKTKNLGPNAAMVGLESERETIRASEAMLRIYAAEYVRETRTRDPEAVIAELDRRLRERFMTVGPDIDLRALVQETLENRGSQVAPVLPVPAEPTADTSPQEAFGEIQDARLSAQETDITVDETPGSDGSSPIEGPSDSGSRSLTAVGTLEIDRVIRAFLKSRGDVDAETIINHVLDALSVDDRSPLAIDRLNASITRERTRLAEVDEPAEQRSTGTADVSHAEPSRSSVMEFSSRDLERALAQMMAERRWSSDKAMVDAVLDTLGLDARSPLARERVMRLIEKSRSTDATQAAEMVPSGVLGDEAPATRTSPPANRSGARPLGSVIDESHRPTGPEPLSTSSEEEATSAAVVETSQTDRELDAPGTSTDASVRGLPTTANCYLIGRLWAIRIEIDEEVLSGATRPLPEEFADHLGVPPMSSHPFRVSQRSTVTIERRETGASITRVDGPARNLSLGIGDHIFLIASARRSGRLESRLLLKRDLEGLRPAQRAARLMGLPRRAPAAALPLALDLASSAPLEEIVAALSIRGEEDLVRMLLEDPVPFHLHDAPTPVGPRTSLKSEAERGLTHDRPAERTDAKEVRTADSPMPVEDETPHADVNDRRTAHKRAAEQTRATVERPIRKKQSDEVGQRATKKPQDAPGDEPRPHAPDAKDIADLLGL